jgi:hypothetical protein
MSTVETLGRIGAKSPESLAAINAALSDSSEDVRYAARKAMQVVQKGPE